MKGFGALALSLRAFTEQERKQFSRTRRTRVIAAYPAIAGMNAVYADDKPLWSARPQRRTTKTSAQPPMAAPTQADPEVLRASSISSA